MKYYLVDYENVQNLSGLENLSQEDVVVIFYSKNANNVTFDTVLQIQNSKCKIEYKKVAAGKNALDFQLSSYLGYLLKEKENKDCEFYIISKDKGYNNIIEFWQNEKNIEVNMFANLKGQTQQKLEEKHSNEIKDVLVKVGFNFSDEDINKINSIISNFKTKIAINNNLNKHFKDSDKVGKIIKAIKPFIKDKN